jgi:beta-glucanase (GH16 family)
MTSEQVYTATSSLADGYHTYTLEWTPDYVLVVRRRDGQED